MKKTITISKYLIPLAFVLAIVVTSLMSWQGQSVLFRGGTNPLFRSLSEGEVWIRRGFDPAEVSNKIFLNAKGAEGAKDYGDIVNDSDYWAFPDSGYIKFETPAIAVAFSPLPDLPKRKFLSPHKAADEEFTMIVPIEIDEEAMEYLNANPLLRPGLYFIVVFGNWEFYFNGTLIDSQMYLDENGQIIKGKNRNWYHNPFPIDRSLIIPGTNILTMRVIGDPTVIYTGSLFFPSYFDDYSLIQKRQNNYWFLMVYSFLGFAGIYCLFIFFSVRSIVLKSTSERYYLYFGIYSLLMCIFNIFAYGLIRTEFFDIASKPSIMLLIAMLANVFYGMFVENIGRGKTTLVTKLYLCISITFNLIMQFGSSIQFIEEMQLLYVPVYYSYLLYMIFYNIIYFSFWDKKGPRKTGLAIDASVYNIFIVTTLVYLPEIIRSVIRIFGIVLHFGQYSSIILIIGIFIILAGRYRRMYKRLEDSHIILEKTVEERTGELKARSLELEQANRAKSDFLATMSHEIRTPLNAVIGLSDIEMRTLPQSETRDSFAQIHQSGTYLLGIINDILDISKIESGNIELNPAEYDTAQMISEVVNLNKVRLGNKPIDFTVDIDGDFPARLVGDELRIKQVLNNLLSNAVKFTDSGEINLRIFLTQRAQSTQRNTLDSEDPNIHLCDLSGLCGENSLRICFEVRDTGIGIRAEDVDKLFRDYSQLDTGANRKYEGTGLGLAITKRLVEMMGGTITVESEYGKGSTFTAQIVQQFTEEKEEMNNIIHELPIPSAHSVKPCASVRDNIKILAVDDVAGNLLLIRKMLAPYGVVVNTADNGKEAVGMIEAGKYDLIFMDHMMPGMDGIETLQKINRTYSSEKSHLRSGENRNERLPPIIMLTATAMTGMKEYYLEQGFDDYLSKPINAKELDELLKRWLGVGSGGEEAGQLTYSQDYLSEHRRLAIEITERKKWDLKADSEVMGIEHEQVKPLLHRFKEEVVMGNLDEAEKILFEIGSFNLDQPARKFYYTLHNCILTMDIKKIMELL